MPFFFHKSQMKSLLYHEKQFTTEIDKFVEIMIDQDSHAD